MDPAILGAIFGCLALGYGLGSIPFGLLLTHAAGLGDVRSIGSGNIGATNVLRTGNKSLAAATLALDLLKGTAATSIGAFVLPLLTASPLAEPLTGALAGGTGAFLGHVFPIWLGFKGGKGVATYIGVLLGIAWQAALAFCAVWLAVALVTRYSSLSALIAALLAPLMIWWLVGTTPAVVFTGLSALLIAMHHANIRRLIAGEEHKIGGRAKAP
jgi:glycerol-3-phosphate acyltransferase PlsY